MLEKGITLIGGDGRGVGGAQRSISSGAGNFKASLQKQLGTQTRLNIVTFYGFMRGRLDYGEPWML